MKNTNFFEIDLKNKMNNPNVEMLLQELSSAIANLNSKFDATSARYETMIQELRSENQRLSNEMSRIQSILKSLQGSTPGIAMEIDAAPSGSAASKYSTATPTAVVSSKKPATGTTTVTKNIRNKPVTTAAAPSNNWVQVLGRKPKAPLSDRKKSATARAFFAPPTNDSNAPTGYCYVYIPRSRNINRKDVRHRFSVLGIETARVLDISFPARSVIGILLHEEYKSTFLQEVLVDCKVKPIEGFNPCDPVHIADPKYQDWPAPQRARLAVALQQDRCYNTLNFIREYLIPSVSKFFVAQAWIPQALAASVIQHRLPRPVKKTRTESSYGKSAADEFVSAVVIGDQDCEMGEEFAENAYDSDNSNDSTTDDDDEAPCSKQVDQQPPSSLSQ